MIDKTIGTVARVLTVIYWVIIFLAIFIPNSVDYWLSK